MKGQSTAVQTNIAHRLVRSLSLFYKCGKRKGCQSGNSDAIPRSYKTDKRTNFTVTYYKIAYCGRGQERSGDLVSSQLKEGRVQVATPKEWKCYDISG